MKKLLKDLSEFIKSQEKLIMQANKIDVDSKGDTVLRENLGQCLFLINVIAICGRWRYNKNKSSRTKVCRGGGQFHG